MQEKKHHEGKELICINVDKVFDWIVKEKSFDVSPRGFIHFPGIPKHLHHHDLRGATVSCEVKPDQHHPIVILGREDCSFCIDGKTVILQRLTIKKKFDLTIFITLRNGCTYPSENIDVSRSEQITLCAPKETEVEITYTNLDCFVSSTGELEFKHEGEYGNPAEPTLEGPHPVNSDRIKFSDLSISIDTCQSIQSTFPVTVEFLADYCEPREDLATACAPPMRPQQCSVVFPDDDHDHCCH
ncbi:hypothetical protein I2483_14055 [Sporosarcina sp. E16_3]|uniref:hypothetical protein n=1 Tax=Sporosarcina sp. E16_3 TaxID=2789293 RepID=UPI001A920E95|nr:hypothetical protein [Sporosarcina sp. E16_3]MBO0602788.1 hypothetical protein [Sporosarcina sp. E16_3]